MINNVSLVGRITRDPELKKTQNGVSVVSFNLAVNRKFKKEGQQDADFINCVAWNRSADFLGNYIKKGYLLGIEGRIETRNYDDKDGKKVYVTEVVCDTVQALESKSQRQDSQSQDSYKDTGATLNITSDDLPF